MEDLLTELMDRAGAGDEVCEKALKALVRLRAETKVAQDDATRLAQRNTALVWENEMMRLQLDYKRMG